jgi:phosphoribosylformylglycinamidine cyclo-ligase
MIKDKSLTYADSGVDIETGNEVVSVIKPLVQDTHNDSVLSNIGGFGGLFELHTKDYKRPILVSSTDGVGTKLKLAQALGKEHLIGIDLVAMCANDVIVQGAKPLFFLDYYATSKLEVAMASRIIQGIVQGCKESNMALIGGETAEMPGIYQSGDFDLAGFCVGLVDFDNIIDGSSIEAGDVVIGMFSSGPHSNGYSLIRKIIDIQKSNLESKLNDATLGDALIEPTIIYVKPILNVIGKFPINGIAHITGGGFKENIERILPNHCNALIETSCWNQPDVFNWIQNEGKISEDEMFNTFNCGIGMVLIIKENHASEITETFLKLGYQSTQIGYIENGTGQVMVK